MFGTIVYLVHVIFIIHAADMVTGKLVAIVMERHNDTRKISVLRQNARERDFV